MTKIWEELRLTPVINAQGFRTLLGGNTPSPAVSSIMDEIDDHYFDMSELLDRVGEWIAEMLGVEDVLVTSGCAAALAVGAAGLMTGTDAEKVERIPDVTGMPHEFIIQRQLRIKYDRCVTIPGGKLIEVGEANGTRPEHIEAAIGPKTAGIHYLVPKGNRQGALSLEQLIEIGHSRNIPIIVDAAPRVYPIENMSKFAKMGADLVCYGAKYFGAINSSGMLTGKKEYVEAARLNSFIGFEATTVRSFARAMKLDRRNVIAVYAALREWLTMNHEDRYARYEARISSLRHDLDGIPGIEMEYHPTDGPAEGLLVRVDSQLAGKSAEDVIGELRNGSPSIWVRETLEFDPDEMDEEEAFVIRMPTLAEGDEKAIAKRLREILRG